MGFFNDFMDFMLGTTTPAEFDVDNTAANAMMGMVGNVSNPFASMTNTYSNMANPYAGLSNQYAGLTNTMSGLQSQYAGLTNQFAGLDNTMSGLTNQFANLPNQFANLENTMEDLTVNQQQAQFEAQQNQQNQANILDSLRTTAGGSGIANLAQSLAREGQLASQRASASIGTQEAQNERLRAQEAGRLQQLEAGEASRLQTMSAEEQAALNMAEAQQAGSLQMAEATGGTNLQMAQAGDLASLQMAAAQQGNQLQLAQAEGATGLQMAQAGFGGQALMAEAGAGMDIQSQIAQGALSAQELQANMLNQLMGYSVDQSQLQISAAAAGQEQHGLMDLVGPALQIAAMFSDKRLKKNINTIGVSPSGINIYTFEYVDKKIGEGLFQGVMAQEVPHAAIELDNGYLAVDYSKLDVEFKRIK